MCLNMNLQLVADDNQNNDADDSHFVSGTLPHDDENDDQDDHDDDHLGGGALPQALLAHAKVCNLDVALLHNIQLQDGCTNIFLEKTDSNSAHEYHDDDCDEHCLVKHDVVQFQVSVNNSMLARK